MSALRGKAQRERAELQPDMAAAQALSAMRRPVELVLLAILLAIYASVHALDISSLYAPMNVAGPVALVSILGWSCYRIVRQSPIAVWAPLFWFRLACAAYYGFGALVPHIVNEETRAWIFVLHHFDDALNLKVNFIYVAGIFLTLTFSFFFLKRRRGIRPTAPTMVIWQNPSRVLLLFALCFLAVGGILRYGFIVPYSFGLTQTLVPGAFSALSRMYYVGIFLIIAYMMAYNKKIWPIVFILIAFEVFVSIASFLKTELMFIIIFSFLGFISRETTKTKLFVGASCVALAFLSFQSLVGYGRAELTMRYGDIRGAGLQERWDIVRDYLDGGREAVATTPLSGLSRLSYVNVGAFVVDQYDAGLPGDTLRNAPAVLIPRVLWPGKPIITQVGADLNILVFGQEGSQLGIGHFAEAYWNFGWWGIAPFMAVLALILSVFTKISIRIMARKDWLFLPVVFIGVNMGLRVDGFLVPDILGPAWMAICLGLALMAINVVIGAFYGKKKRLTQGLHRA